MNTFESPSSLHPDSQVDPSDSIRRFRHFGGGEFTYFDYNTLFSALKTDPQAFADLPELRVAVLRNFTVESLMPVLAGEIVTAGFRPEFYIGDFDSIAADVLDENSALFRFRPDFVLFANWLEGLHPGLANRFLCLTPEQVDDAVNSVRANQLQLLTTLRERTKAVALVNNFPIPPFPTLGILDAQRTSGQTATLLALNAGIAEDTRTVADTYVVDLMRLVGDVGYRNAVNDRYWHLARAPLAHAGLIAYGRECGRFFRALRGRSRKCLVLDCDNTLWGGIVGEDGLDGIKIDTTYPGSCFRAFQEEILNLYQRGVILALCSKNNELDVLTVLREHPDMVLREEHFAITMINWDDKVTNLRQIAAELNIGLDSLVFVDDNAFETNFVARALPEVAIIQLPTNPASFRACLARTGLFDSLTLSEEDKQRTQMYRSDRQRAVLQKSNSNLADYLVSLDTHADLRPPTRAEISRVSQLTQKTNQFNLTTRRYSEGEVTALNHGEDSEVVSLTAGDKVSELGLVGVAVVRYQDDVAEIDSFLMSCRALGRGLEDAFLHTVVANARKRGTSQVLGVFRPTSKNAQCINFYERNGFRKRDETAAGTIWELPTDHPAPSFPAWIRRVKEADSVAQ